ncbi:odorant receptor 43a-like [Anopheles marshallii]|uniref:odorant receptor 43a-like n=1 Tax=Anopheles marshallii TaxID=1521116 RepID=UPI00237A1EDD|nr:odorant receptor 43a-like [Anopheles marshallii]
MAVDSEIPIDRFDRILSWQYHILRILGMDAYTKTLYANPRSGAVVLLAGLFFASSFYDIFVLFRDDLFQKSFVMATLGFCVIGSSRVSGAWIYRSDLPKLMQMARDTYLNGMQDERQTVILRWYTEIFWRGVMLYSMMFLIGVTLAPLSPALLFLYNGEKILPFGVYLPFMDPNSQAGYELNYMFQICCVLCTPPGLTASQNIYFGFILNICIQYDVLQLHIADLDEILHRTEQHGNDNAVREKLCQIIIGQRRLEQFVQYIEYIFSGQAIVEVVSLSFEIVLMLYVLRTLFILCVPGMLIQVKASKLTEAIYGIAWHELNKENKRIFHLLLHRSQHPSGLTCAGMVDIDLNLFVNVMKKVYSIFMMMKSM